MFWSKVDSIIMIKIQLDRSLRKIEHGYPCFVIGFKNISPSKDE